jgi:hypothetical protein
MRRDVAEIGKNTQLYNAGPQAELDRLAGIVRHGLSSDMAVAHIEPVPRPDEHAVLKPIKLRATRRSRSQKHG